MALFKDDFESLNKKIKKLLGKINPILEGSIDASKSKESEEIIKEVIEIFYNDAKKIEKLKEETTNLIALSLMEENEKYKNFYKNLLTLVSKTTALAYFFSENKVNLETSFQENLNKLGQGQEVKKETVKEMENESKEKNLDTKVSVLLDLVGFIENIAKTIVT